MVEDFYLANLRAKASGGYTDQSGYHDSSGNVIVTADEIRNDPNNARAKLMQRIKQRQASRQQTSRQSSQQSRPNPYTFNYLNANAQSSYTPQGLPAGLPAGSSSLQYGHVDSTGKQVNTPSQLRAANQARLNEMTKQAKARELAISKSNERASTLNRKSQDISNSIMLRNQQKQNKLENKKSFSDVTRMPSINEAITLAKADNASDPARNFFEKKKESKIKNVEQPSMMTGIYEPSKKYYPLNLKDMTHEIKVGEPGYMSSDVLGTTRTSAEAQQYTDIVYDENKDELIKNIKTLLDKDVNIDTSNKEQVYDLVNTYNTADNKLQKVLDSVPTGYDKYILDNKIASSLGYETSDALMQDINKQKSKVQNVVAEYANIKGDIQSPLAIGDNVYKYSDIVIKGATSPKKFDKVVIDTKQKSDFEKDVFSSPYEQAISRITFEANDKAGPYGKILFNEKDQLNMLSVLDARTAVEGQPIIDERKQIQKEIDTTDTRVENTYNNYELSTGETPKKILSNTEKRKKYEKEFFEQQKLLNNNMFLTDDNVPVIEKPSDLTLSTFVIRDDINDKYQTKLEKLRTQYTGQKKQVEGDDGIIRNIFSYDTQEGLDAEKKLFDEYNKEMQTFSETASKDFSQYGKQQDEVDALNANYEKFNKIVEGRDKALETIKGMDFTYTRKKELQAKIDENKFKEWSKPGVFDAVFPTLYLAKQPGVQNIGRTLIKDVGGFITQSGQGVGQLGKYEIDKMFDSTYTDVAFDKKDKFNIRDKYDIKSGADKAKEGAAVAGILALGAASGGAGWAAGFAGSMALQPVASYGFEELGYMRASDEEKAIMKDYSTFREGMRQSWDAENIKIKQGWDSKEGGFDGLARETLSTIPLSGYIPGVGSKDAFKEQARTYYEGLGYTGDKLEAAVNASARQRRYGIGGEAAGILLGNIGAEVVGRRALTKAVLKGTGTKSFWTGVSKIGSAGIVEGSIIEQARQDKEYEDRDYYGQAKSGAMGYASAGLIGGGMVWSGAGGKLNKFLQGGGYVTDWFEYPGDKLADLAEKTLPFVRKYTGKIRPKTFSFASPNALGANTNIKISTKDITGITPTTGGAEITYIDGKTTKTFTIANTKSNVNTLSSMQNYYASELSSVSGKNPNTLSFAQSETALENELSSVNTASNTEVPEKDLTNVIDLTETRAEQQSNTKSDTLSTSTVSDVFSNAQTNIKDQTDTDPNPNTNTNINPNTQTQTQSNVAAFTNPQALAMTGVFSSTLPLGGGGIGGGSSKYGFGAGVGGWLSQNKIADYAGDWLNRRRQAVQQIKQNSQTGYRKAQNSMDRMFGKNIASGNQFKSTFGPAIGKNNIDKSKFIFNKRRQNAYVEERAPTFKQPQIITNKTKGTSAILKMFGKSK